MPIYLSDLERDPGILMRGLEGKKSRAQLREQAEDTYYEALGVEIEKHPLGGHLAVHRRVSR
jgi:hypothetical protein